MKKITALLLAGLLLVGCGGDSTPVETPSDNPKTETLAETDTTANYYIAKDNTLHDVNVTFEIFRVVVYADKELDDTPSNSTKAIYGKINGTPTNALLSVNSNYENGTAFIVKVYKDSILVGESEKAILSAGTLEFSDITTK